MDVAKHLLFYLAFVLFVVFSTHPASAHILKSNSSIAVVLHITPDDDPIVGATSDIYLDFNDREKKVTAQSCDCRISISQKETLLHTEPLFSYSSSFDTSTGTQYIFPTKGVYQVTISGMPKNEGEFENFSFTYDIRVAKEDSQKTSANDSSNPAGFVKSHIPHIIAAGIVLAFFIFALIKQQASRKLQ